MKKWIYTQGILEVSLLVLNYDLSLMLYRVLMLYFNYKQDKANYKKSHLEAKSLPFLKIQQILITISFVFLSNQKHAILTEFATLMIQHMLVHTYQSQFTFCESYALSQYIVEYFKLVQGEMFAYLSEIVLILAIITFILIKVLSKVPIKEMAFAITAILILKINFFSILYYLDYKHDSLNKLIREIMSPQFTQYFVNQFICLLILIPVSYFRGSKIIQRKLFHFQIFIIVYCGYYQNINYTKLALAVFIWLFIVFEGLRQIYRTNIPILQKYSNFMMNFCDERDSDDFIKTHIYLMMGISHSVFISNSPFIGIIALGIGDSMAAIVGSKFGRFKYYKSNRTVEGSIAFIIFSTLAGYFMTGKINNWILGGIVEAYTSQIDNLIIPKILLNPIICDYLF